MGEWFNPAVLKTVEPGRVPGVRIPLPPPENYRDFSLANRKRTRSSTGALPNVSASLHAMASCFDL
jgi:hypothetical protein